MHARSSLLACLLLSACGALSPWPPDDGTPVAPVLSAGYRHTCRVNADTTVSCWGWSMFATTGGGVEASTYFAPEVVPGLTGVAQVASGQHHVCVRLLDGTAKCWGNAANGRLGNGATSGIQETPVAVKDLTGLERLAAGESHTCATLTDGTVKCWGANRDGQLGLVARKDHAVPIAIPDLTGATELTLGSSAFSCARFPDGTAKCWGLQATDGRLGNGHGDPGVYAPLPVAGLTGVKRLALGIERSCAVKDDRTLWCWGMVLENATLDQRATPVQVAGLDQVVEVSSANPVCVRRADRGVWCLGFDSTEQRGVQNTGLFGRVPGLGGAAQLVGGNAHFCAWLLDGTAWCWGDNFYGQIGDGTKVARRDEPRQVQ